MGTKIVMVANLGLETEISNFSSHYYRISGVSFKSTYTNSKHLPTAVYKWTD